jgi:ribose transport system permease protein
MELSRKGPRAGTESRAVKLVRQTVSIPEMGVLIPLVIFIVLFSMINPAMLSRVNITVIMRTIAFTGVVAVGMSFLIIAGEIDLSVGSVAGLGAIVSGWMMKNAGWPVPAAVVAGLLTGGLCGLVNGLMTVKVGLPSFVATLAMLFIARGVNYVITSAYPIYPLPPVVGEFGLATPLGILGLLDLCISGALGRFRVAPNHLRQYGNGYRRE